MYEYTATLIRVVDGDTLDLSIDIGFKLTTVQRIRLSGIDTPEIWRRKHTSEEYKKGMKAKAFVVKRLEDNDNKLVIRTDKGTGVYGRYIGTLLLSDSEISLNEELLQKRYAVVWQ